MEGNSLPPRTTSAMRDIHKMAELIPQKKIFVASEAALKGVITYKGHSAPLRWWLESLGFDVRQVGLTGNTAYILDPNELERFYSGGGKITTPEEEQRTI